MPGSMPEDSDEVIAMHGTPPDANSRARARTTATELGARNAPPPKKKASKSGSKARLDVSDPDDPDGLLAEATSILGEDAPRPIRMAHGELGKSPSKRISHARSPAVGATGDEVSKFLSDEELMNQLLEATK